MEKAEPSREIGARRCPDGKRLEGAPVAVEDGGDLGRGGGGGEIEQAGAVGGGHDVVVGVGGGEQLLAGAVELNAVGGGKVGVPGGLLAGREEKYGAGGLVDVKEFGDVAVAMGDLVLELAGGGVIKVELPPIAALGVPEDFVGAGKEAPGDLGDAAFERCLRVLGEDVADGSGGGVGEAKLLVLVVAGGGDEGEAGAVGAPLDVVPAVAFGAGQIVAERAAVEVGGHVEADQPGDLGAGEVEDNAVELGDLAVTREGIPPGVDLGMADGGGNAGHAAGLAEVELKGGNLFGIGRPDEDGVGAAAPAGVVGGIAEVGQAVVGELEVMASVEVADPEVVPADKGGERAVGRDSTGSAGARDEVVGEAAAGGPEVATDTLGGDGESDRVGGVVEGKVVEGQVVGVDGDRTESLRARERRAWVRAAARRRWSKAGARVLRAGSARVKV